MAKIKIDLNHKNIGELLKSEEMESYLQETVERMAEECGDGYEFDTYKTPSRMIASVFTAKKNAVKDNLENNTLLRCLR